jgi:hypothetical protein
VTTAALSQTRMLSPASLIPALAESSAQVSAGDSGLNRVAEALPSPSVRSFPPKECFRGSSCWSRARELNQRPTDYEWPVPAPRKFFCIEDLAEIANRRASFGLTAW